MSEAVLSFKLEKLLKGIAVGKCSENSERSGQKWNICCAVSRRGFNIAISKTPGSKRLRVNSNIIFAPLICWNTPIVIEVLFCRLPYKKSIGEQIINVIESKAVSSFKLEKLLKGIAVGKCSENSERLGQKRNVCCPVSRRGFNIAISKTPGSKRLGVNSNIIFAPLICWNTPIVIEVLFCRLPYKKSIGEQIINVIESKAVSSFKLEKLLKGIAVGKCSENSERLGQKRNVCCAVSRRGFNIAISKTPGSKRLRVNSNIIFAPLICWNTPIVIEVLFCRLPYKKSIGEQIINVIESKAVSSFKLEKLLKGIAVGKCSENSERLGQKRNGNINIRRLLLV
ncbi:hypothetical protein FQA39_LY04716 [Lamprigera yunnana]|nr:hypothetical protein FQA39_LY04716 [Lamprigera yunnana]